jgi:probable phosphoglycerate mutase
VRTHLRLLAGWYAVALATRLAGLTWPRRVRYRFPYRAHQPYHVRQAWRPMQDSSQNLAANGTAPPSGAQPANAAAAAEPLNAETQGALHPAERPAPKPPRLVLLVRHGQTTYNIEGRLPGQLEGVALTDEGRSQAWRAAVALSALPLSAVFSSPLERALETARIIARGFALDVRQDARLMDTDVGPWAGQKIKDLEQSDPAWKAFVEHPTAPPPDVESLAAVQERAVAACEALRRDESLGNYVVLVAHADVVKLILAHYSRMHIDSARFVFIGNAAISALAFPGDGSPDIPPHVLAINWTPLPHWLAPPPWRPAIHAKDAAGHAPAATTSAASAPDGHLASTAPTAPTAADPVAAGEKEPGAQRETHP